jgi:hypothetical protein
MSLIAVRSIAFLRFPVLAGAVVLLGATSMYGEAGMPELPSSTSAAATPAVAAPFVAPVSTALNFRTPAGPAAPCQVSDLDSPYIPLDSWVYPAMLRLNALGYLDSMFTGLRPYTRASVIHMLEETDANLEDAPDNATTDEAQEIYDKLWAEVNKDAEGPCFRHRGQIHLESTFTVMRGITGTPLHDSWHIGESITNDYGRPIEGGFNNYSGVSGYATAGIFSLYARTEYQYSPSAAGYSQALFEQLSTLDSIPYATNPNQATIPLGPIGTQSHMRLVEGYVSAHTLGHEISFGKQDEWMGVAQGGGYGWTNNAENIYSFRINRTDPLYVPLVSRIFGPFRYDFLVGSLKGHTFYSDPWVHGEKISLKPTPNLEFGFQRTVIWGGKGHVPITIHSFLKSFFSISNVTLAEKTGHDDPGARFGEFDVNYRLPFVRHWLTFFTDSDSHDDVSPISAPRRAAFRTGLYLSHVPAVPKLDLRVEAAMDDQSTSRSLQGKFTYYEAEQPQGFTNAGQIMGDWMGREAKGGQAWATWHLSGNEFIQASWRGQKAAKDFIAGGTTLNDFTAAVVKRIGPDLELKGNFTYEQYLAPIYKTDKQTVTNTTFQLTWYPTRKVSF